MDVAGFIVSLGQRLESWVTYVDCFLIACLLIKEEPLPYLMITLKKIQKLLSKNVERAIHHQLTLMWKWTQSFQQTGRSSWAVRKRKIHWFALISPSTRGRSRQACFRPWGCRHNDCFASTEQSNKKECRCSLYWYWRIYHPFASFWYIELCKYGGECSTNSS